MCGNLDVSLPGPALGRVSGEPPQLQRKLGASGEEPGLRPAPHLERRLPNCLNLFEHGKTGEGGSQIGSGPTKWPVFSVSLAPKRVHCFETPTVLKPPSGFQKGGMDV